jgi:hypothetical protein
VAEVACQLNKEAPESSIKCSSYVEDDDSTSLAKIF